jgi:hypothetical protein
MFILYAIAAGVLMGYLLGGRLDRLADLRIRFWPVALAGLVVQIVLFTDAGSTIAGDLAPAVYLGSTLAVLGVVLANLRVPGLVLVAVGALSNLIAIVANGGRMPADPAALASLGETDGPGFSNSVADADPVLRPLTDIFAMPAWMPFANVFSIGDVLIGIGIAVAIAAGMRASRQPPRSADPVLGDTARPRPPG